MDSALYIHVREKMLTAAFNWMTGVVRAILLPVTYVPDFNHVYLSSVPAGSRVAVSEPVTGRSVVTGGIARCNAVEFRLVLSTVQVGAALFYRDTGVESTSELIYYLGEEDLVTQPFIPLGLDYFIYTGVTDRGLFRL
jgi:hypothetical protein